MSPRQRAASFPAIAKVRYHIQTERQHQMLIDKYGLTAKDPYNFTVYERAAPLTGNLTEAFGQNAQDTRFACVVPSRS